MRMFIATLCLTACATTPAPAAKGGPRGLHATEHLDVARQHDELARDSSSWPSDPSPGAGGPGIRWVRSWDAAADHDRLASLHRGKAAELNAAYVEACGDRPLEKLSVSPLARYGIGGWNTASGAIVYLSPTAGDPDRLLADLKCHRAWMMLAPAGMENCPLDLPGLRLDATGDLAGITVTIVLRDPKLVPELQRRVALELEAATHGAR